MYSNKDNVNILTALLVKHGVKHAVVCPGSRNAPIVHNLNECVDIQCYAVTDERSAGFYALGMAQRTGEPTVVCVTSGTALLNVSPAVAEAYYQHLPLIVVSADRPAQWIGQLAGQTLQQVGAFGGLVRQSVSLPEPVTDEERWYCNRLVNETLLECNHRSGAPVHINVPISEPLFTFDVEVLPDERKIERIYTDGFVNIRALSAILLKAEKPMIVVGQLPPDERVANDLRRLSANIVVLKEALSPHIGGIIPFDEVLSAAEDVKDYEPDVVIYLGDTVVSKRLKQFLREAKHTKTYIVSTDGKVQDTFMNLAGVVECGNVCDVINVLAAWSGGMRGAFFNLWKHALAKKKGVINKFEPSFSQMQTVRCFEKKLQGLKQKYNMHYANSTAIRLANLYAEHYVWCNRGVNGIEGSLSTAAGMSVICPDELTFCVIGDLSFLYDQNALWNKNISGSLRIVLMNNGCGGIFSGLPGLKNSAALDEFVAGRHNTSAEGICLQNDIVYIKATNEQEMRAGIERIITEKSARPMLIEVFTNEETDRKMMSNI